MDNFRLGLVIIAALVILLLAFFFFRNSSIFPFLSPTKTVTINSHTFSVTLAQTEKDKELGLTIKSSLPQDQGMYFPFSSAGYYSFWMGNMKFPIDIIFIHNGKVVTIFSKAQPQDASKPAVIFKPTEPSNAVLE